MIRKTAVALIVAPVLAAWLPGAGVAHETWLAPSAYSSAPGTVVRLDLTSGMAFPALESPIRPARVARSGVRVGALAGSIGPWRPEERSLAGSFKSARAGLATVWLELGPRDITLDDSQVEEYFDEIGADSVLRAQWAARRGRTGWNEVYTKHAKTFVVVGEAERDSSWRESVGLDVELVPLVSPAALRAGDEVPVLLLSGGRPLPDATIGLMQGPEARTFRRTGADGVAAFVVEKPGPALFFTVLLRPEGDAWSSDFSTLTVRALAP